MSNKKQLKEQKNQREDLFLLFLLYSLFNVFLLCFRIYYTTYTTFIFLVWNLLLAWIPYILSVFLIKKRKRELSKPFFFLTLFVWLLFFPNAPYILTDLFHLKSRAGIPLWFDLIFILSYATNGLFLGLISLNDLHDLLKRKYSVYVGRFFSAFSLILGSFGIYMGRYMRFNSWDIFTNPSDVAGSTLYRIIDPSTNRRPIGLTLLFFCYLSFFYLMIRILLRRKR